MHRHVVSDRHVTDAGATAAVQNGTEHPGGEFPGPRWHPMTLQTWLQRAAIDEGVKPGQSRSEQAELREARKRIRLLEQENEVLRRAAAYLSQANLPGKGSTRS